MSKKNIQTLLENGISAKKHLGQNFLNDPTALKSIVSSAQLNKKDWVLEIGPGTGILTQVLCEQAGQVLAIEKDPDLVKLLQEKIKPKLKTAGHNNLLIFSGDILKINIGKILKEHHCERYKLVANIPYYITGQIIKLFLQSTPKPECMVLLLQKEVAQRICAKAGAMSILGISVQYYGVPTLVRLVPKESFSPIPRVDSAIVKIILKKDLTTNKEATKKFFQLVKIGFACKRKTLANNLVAGLNLKKEKAIELVVGIGFNERTRAQELAKEDWQKMLEKII